MKCILKLFFGRFYSQPANRQKVTNRIVDYVLREGISSEKLYDAIRRFVDVPSKSNLRRIRSLLGIRTNMLAVPLTFVAFLNPKKYPMIDNVVARWVNKNFVKHSRNRLVQLTKFNLASLRDNDFQNYLNRVYWCREMAEILTKEARFK